jgi:hypothetical protein
MTTTRRTKPKRIIRPKNAWKRLGIGHGKFWADYIKTGKLKLVRLAMNASLDGALVLPDSVTRTGVHGPVRGALRCAIR